MIEKIIGSILEKWRPWVIYMIIKRMRNLHYSILIHVCLIHMKYALLQSIIYYPVKGELKVVCSPQLRSGVHYKLYLNKHIHIYTTWSGHTNLIVQHVQ